MIIRQNSQILTSPTFKNHILIRILLIIFLIIIIKISILLLITFINLQASTRHLLRIYIIDMTKKVIHHINSYMFGIRLRFRFFVILPFRLNMLFKRLFKRLNCYRLFLSIYRLLMKMVIIHYLSIFLLYMIKIQRAIIIIHIRILLYRTCQCLSSIALLLL